MGHYASEMSSDWSKSNNRIDKILRLKELAKNVPLSAFMAKDIVILYDLFHITKFTELNDKDIEQIHKRLCIYRALNK